ncbi:hypothetical protein COCOBI_19-1950 [Coccomyxa sp. Obi]|nr:hypothetical protein COCOBI_19-1950 [Coccomyxa sp. Obi]
MYVCLHADLMMKWIDLIGPECVGGLVTDNAANIKRGRQLTVATDGFTHIVEMRCMMHAFSLTVGSLLGHPWAKDLLKRAQRLVTYFQASTRAYSKFLEIAKSLGLKGRLRSSNMTRFTSIEMMLESVIRLPSHFC